MVGEREAVVVAVLPIAGICVPFSRPHRPPAELHLGLPQLRIRALAPARNTVESFSEMIFAILLCNCLFLGNNIHLNAIYKLKV